MNLKVSLPYSDTRMEYENIPSPSAFTPSLFSNIDWTALDFPDSGMFNNDRVAQSNLMMDLSHSWEQQWHGSHQYNHLEPNIQNRIVEMPDAIQEDDEVFPSLDQTSLPARSRRTGPSSEEWDRIRPIFTDLYRDQDLTLDKVMERMSQNHDFEAARHMYNKRIVDWDLRKNMKKAHKESILDTISREGILPESQRKSLRLDKVQRYRREKYKGTKLAHKTRPESATFLMSKTSNESNRVEHVRFRQRGFKATIECIRPPSDTQEFIWLKKEWCELSARLSYGYSASADLDGLLLDAGDLLSENAFSRLTVTLDKFAALFELKAKNPTGAMLHFCIVRLLTPRWLRQRDYQAHLVSYICQTLYKSDPQLAKLVQISLKNPDRSRALALIRLMGDSFYFPCTDESIESRVYFNLHQVECFVDHGDYDFAITLCRGLDQPTELEDSRQEGILLSLGEALYAKGEYEQALETFHQLEDRDRSSWTLQRSYVYTAAIYVELGDFVTGERYAFEALQASIEKCGPADSFTVCRLIALVEHTLYNCHEFDFASWEERFPETWQDAVLLREDAGQSNWPYERMPRI